MIKKNKIKNLKNKRVAIIGAGESGASVAKLVSHIKANPFISESGENISNNCKKFEFEIRGHTKKILDCDLIIISPGVTDKQSILIEAKLNGIPIISEIEFSSWFTSVPILAITGSNGKTTTTLLLDAMCKAGQLNSVAAGNLGIPFSRVVLKELKSGLSPDVYVLELSSFQLEHIKYFSPIIGSILNIIPDHMDRYESFDEYKKTKFNLIKALKEPGWFVYNADDPCLADHINGQNPYHIPFSLNIHSQALFSLNKSKVYYKKNKNDILFNYKDNQLQGNHNIQNILAAATIAYKFGISINNIKQAIDSFKPIPHRIEYCGIINGAKCYNDSKATNIDAVKSALESFDLPIILILGGQIKVNTEFSILYSNFNKVIKEIICYGEASDEILIQLKDLYKIKKINNFENACYDAFENAEKGNILLLSPGCASFDQFKNFEDRGNKFKELIKNYGYKNFE